MDPVYVPLLSALAGALIGAAASVCTILIQSFFQVRRDRLRIIADLAVKDYDAALDIAKFHNDEAIIPPLAAYLTYHREVLEILSKRTLSPDDVRKLVEQQRSLMAEMSKLQGEGR